MAHSLGNVKKLNKNDKLRHINTQIAQGLVKADETSSGTDSDGTQSSDDDTQPDSSDDLVLAELGDFSDEDSETSESSDIETIQPVLRSRSGRRTTTYWTRQCFGD